MITKENKEKLIDDIYEKTSNNKDLQCWIRPSDYGFKHSLDGTEHCKKFLLELNFCKIVRIDGKDLLYIEV